MTIVSNTYLSYSAKGVREQLSDTIYRISPEETPFFSNAKKGKLMNTYFEWQTDALSAAAENLQLEGDDATFSAAVPTKRLGNYAQISNKKVIVSGTLEVVNKAGRKSEEAYQLAMRGAELKRDIELAITGVQVGAAGDSTTPRSTAGFESFILTNASRATTGTPGADPELSGSDNGYPSVAPTDGTQRAFTETLLKAVLALAWENGAQNSSVMVGAFNKQAASAFAGIAANRNVAKGDQPMSIIGAADVYVGDFSQVSIVPNRLSRSRSALVLDYSHISVNFLRPIHMVKLAKTGDADKSLLQCEFGLQLDHEASQGVVADLTTA